MPPGNNASLMNPLNNLSDIEHVLSDSKLETHLQQNMISSENKESNERIIMSNFGEEAGVIKVRSERAYMRLINRNKNHLF